MSLTIGERIYPPESSPDTGLRLDSTGFQNIDNTLSLNQGERNIFQKISDKTGTIITPSNIIDVASMAGSKYGIDRLDTWRGIGTALLSFGADMVDGKVARATGTQSALGEAIDAGGDKIRLAYAIGKIWQMDLAPKRLLVAVAIQNSLNTALTMVDRATNADEPQIHPSWWGKRAILMQQTGIGLHVIGSRLEKDEKLAASCFSKTAGSILGYAGVAFGVVASSGYVATLLKKKL